MPPDHRQVHRDPIRNNDHVQFFGVLCVRKLRKRQVSAFIDSLKFLINCLNLYESFFVFYCAFFIIFILHSTNLNQTSENTCNSQTSTTVRSRKRNIREISYCQPVIS